MPVEWFYTTNKQQMGPVSWDELRQLASSGLLKPNDLVWSEGMAEWVKAVRQNGLFPDVPPASALTAEADAPPPPPRRSATRKRIDEELDEHDESDRKERRKTRKKSGSGLKIGVIIGLCVLALFVLGCGVVGVIAIVFGLSFGGGIADYRVNLAPFGQGSEHNRNFTFQAGQRVTVTVTTDRHFGPIQPDVDLFVLRRGGLIASDQDLNPDASVTFVAPATDNYTIRVKNLGPVNASSRVVVR